MTRHEFAAVPADPTGDWTVSLPAGGGAVGNRIGEVLLYATAVGSGFDHLVWPLAALSCPLTEVGGFDHTLQESGIENDTVNGSDAAIHFGLLSMRSDDGGASMSEPVGYHDLYCVWEPDVATVGDEFTVAFLLGTASGYPFADNYANVTLEGIMRVERFCLSAVEEPVGFRLWDGSDWDTVDASTTVNPALTTPRFLAFRVATGGVWKRWVGTSTATGTHGAYDPDAVWRLSLFLNDPETYKFQEIHVWDRAATDAEVEAVRNDMLGV